MNKTVKVTVENGPNKKEIPCELFAGMMISKEGNGYQCEQIITGITTSDGVFSALRMLKQLEEHLYDALPYPKKLAKMKLGIEESLRKAMESNGSDDEFDHWTFGDSFLSALIHACDHTGNEEDTLQEILEWFHDPSESGDAESGDGENRN